jgi:4-hydroxy-tetrahydrodipicolinate reductase
MAIRVCVAGVSGRRAGQRVGAAVAGVSSAVAISATVAQALDGCDVLVDYTSAVAVKGHVLAAIERGVHVVIGSSGLTDDEHDELDGRAREAGVGLFAAGNFAITAVLLQRFAEPP